MPTISQDSMDEAVLMTRTLSLLQYIDSMFQDHGNKPLSLRAIAVRDFIREEMRRGNPHDEKAKDACCFHQFFLVEVLGEDALMHPSLADLHYHITDGHYSGEVTETNATYMNRSLTDEMLMAQGSDPEFLSKEDDEPEQDNSHDTN